MGSCQQQLAVAAIFVLLLLNACSYSNRSADKPPPPEHPVQEEVKEIPKPDIANSTALPKEENAPRVEKIPEPVTTTTSNAQPTKKPEPRQAPTPVTTPVTTPTTTPTTSKTELTEAVPEPEPVEAGSLQGVVKISGKKNKTWKPSNVIATLRPVNSAINKKNTPATHEVDMRNKTYHPVAQTILKGDSLQFNNHDDIKHNVFSSSGDNTFDLGTFEGSGTRTVALHHTGIVKVYCNIHPEMATFVMVADNPFNAISNRKGEFTINNIPPGKYTLSLWHIRGELQTEIEITADTRLQQDFNIDGSNYQRSTHKNKFGEDYEKKPALFEDEFY